MKNQKDHKFYKRVPETEADACAWVFTSPTKLEKYFYKLPKLSKDEILIKITYSGICMSDIMTINGKWGQANFPICPGHEIVGEIVKLGENCEILKKDEKEKIFKIGEKVLVGPFRDNCGNCEFCKKGETNYCVGILPSEKNLYGKYFGGFSTHVQVKKNHVYALPKNLDEKKIAPIMCAGITTFLAINKNVKEGDKVGIIGCGGLGHFAIQWTKKKKAEVDLLTSSHKKDKMAKELGINKILIWKEKEHISEMNNYDVLVNTLPCDLNNQEFNSFLKILKPKGKFLQIGLPSSKGVLEVDPFLLVVKGIEIIGSEVGGVRDYREMFEFVKEHGVECVCETYEWEEFPKAVERIVKGKPVFRCVVDVGKFSSGFGKK